MKLPLTKIAIAAAVGLAAATFVAARPLTAPASASVEIAAMTWVEVRDAIGRGATTVIVPSGGLEQNGIHMAIGKHDAIVGWTARRIAQDLGHTLVAPVLPFVPEGDWDPPTGNMTRPGTIGVSEAAFEATLEGIARSLRTAGFTTICFIADHGGSQRPQAAVAARLDREWAAVGVRVVGVDGYYAVREQDAWMLAHGETVAGMGDHAGLADTSELLAVEPDAVDLARLGQTGWSLEQTGGSGEPARATAELGRALLAIKIDAATRQIRALRPPAGRAPRAPPATRSARETSMIAELVATLLGFGRSVVQGLPMMVAIGAVVPVLTIVSGRCNDQGHWWRNPGIAVDLCYWFVLPLIGSFLRLGFVVTGAFLILGMRDPDALSTMVEGGRGPIAALPKWGQVALYMGATDLLMYGTHRLFHGKSLWRYHAIHHSSADVDWTAAFRFHPVNIAFHTVLADAATILCGMPIDVLIIVAPVNAVISAMVHANLPWTFGPFRYVLASPVFHRWHHTDWRRGGSMNFAPTFPIIDVAFGTFFMPPGELPSGYGTDDEFLPESFLAQMLYPFRKPVRGSAFGTAARPAPEAVALQAD